MSNNLYTLMVDGEAHVGHATWAGIMNILSLESFADLGLKIEILPYVAPVVDLNAEYDRLIQGERDYVKGFM